MTVEMILCIIILLKPFMALKRGGVSPALRREGNIRCRKFMCVKMSLWRAR